MQRRTKDDTDRLYKKIAVYSVWNNYTDEVVIIDGTVEECAKAMGISPNSFSSMMTRTHQGKTRKWTFEKTLIREMEEDDHKNEI